MSRKLFGNNIDPCCEYCAHGKVSSDGNVYCLQKGVVPQYYSCKWFVYAPLKRIPRRPPTLPNYDPEDFSLEDI